MPTAKPVRMRDRTSRGILDEFLSIHSASIRTKISEEQIRASLKTGANSIKYCPEGIASYYTYVVFEYADFYDDITTHEDIVEYLEKRRTASQPWEQLENSILTTKKKRSPFAKAVEMYDYKTGEIIDWFESISDAERETGIPHSSIGRVANGRRQKIKYHPYNECSHELVGFRFVYAEDQHTDSKEVEQLRQVRSENRTARIQALSKPVRMRDYNTREILGEFDSIIGASRETKIHAPSIRRTAQGKQDATKYCPEGSSSDMLVAFEFIEK